MSKILIMLAYFLILLFSCLLYKKVTREGYRENNVNKDKLTKDFWKYLNNSVNSTVEDKIDNSIDDKIDDKINNITDGIEDIVETSIKEKYNDFLLSDEFKNQVDTILSKQFDDNEEDTGDDLQDNMVDDTNQL
tara:strand:- start:21 stop:422 length:402 start_codon:yes stop_codon:yes gene_type:complete